MSHSAISVATAFVRAINRQEVTALTELMTADHSFVDSLGNVCRGREVMQANWAAYFRMVPDYSLAIEESYVQDSAVVMIGIAQGTYTPDGTLNAESHWETPIAIRALIEDGRMAEWRIYADNEPIRLCVSRNKHNEYLSDIKME